MRIAILSMILVLSISAPALAAEKDAKDAKADAGGQYIDLSPVAAPIVLNGQLINYIFVTLRLDLASNVDAIRMREKEPYYRDAFVRIAHRKPFMKPGDYTHVNEPALKAAMLVEAAKIAGPRAVIGVEIKSAQPQKLTGLPRPPGPPAPRAPIP